jgi:hypothetical protein
MLNKGDFTRAKRDELWAEAGATATKLDNILVRTPGSESSYKKFHSTDPKWIRHMRTFGEVGIVTDHANKKARGKLEDRGYACIFVGYLDNHSGNVYRMYNLKTGKIVMSHDLTWLGKTWGEHVGITKRKMVRLTEAEESDTESVNSETVMSEASNDDADEEENEPETESSPTSGRLSREMRRLATYYNEEASETIQQELAELALVTLFGGGERDTLTFQEAWNHPDPVERAGWREGIRKEFKDMISRGVWRKRKHRDIPADRRLIGSKWVFKKKKNGVYRPRLVALGYSQIPGVDYTENFAPVVHDITLRTVLITMLLLGLKAELVDVETAFLEGDMDTELYMKIPEGLEHIETIENDDCLQLIKCIYGSVQAARQFWKKFVETLEGFGFVRSKADPCLLTRRNGKGIVMLCLYVDDVLIVGNQEAIDEVKIEIDTVFKTKKTGKLTEYVGVTIQDAEDAPNAMLLSQPDAISRLEKYFLDDVKDVKEYKTPMAQSYGVQRPKEDVETVSLVDQSKYRSGVGSLLYLVKHSRPDISNAVRELSKVMDGATEAHMKDMYRVIKYVFDTKDRCVRLDPQNTDEDEWIVEAFSDSDYGGDKDTRKSVTGYVIFINGALVAWKSRGQKSVTLSSTEGEYIAASETATEMVFIMHLLESLGVKVQYPMRLRVDNAGAIFIAKNESVSRTKHVDIRAHYVRELVANRTIEITYVNTKENDADVNTKNLGSEPFERHTSRYWSGHKHSSERGAVQSDSKRKGVGDSVIDDDLASD